MERSPYSKSGQALVEIILGVTVITLLIAVTTHLALNFKKLFKHNYVESIEKGSPEIPMATIFKDKMIYFQNRSAPQNIHILKEKGWEISKKLKVEEGLLYFLENGHSQMVFTDNVGVISCLSDCEKN